MAAMPEKAQTYQDDDADLAVVSARNVAVLGDGRDARVHALCLRDSGVDVRLGTSGESGSRAESEGLRVVPAYEACEEADLVMVLAPAEAHRRLYAEAVEPNLVDGDALFFGDGFSIRFGLVAPPVGVDVALVAAAGPAHRVRREYVEGRGVPVLVAVEQDATGSAWDLARSYAKAIGGLRAGGLPTTFAEQTEAGLFGEQAVGCGGVPALVRAGFETLTEAGYRPEVAYLACLQELQQVVNRLCAGGLPAMRAAVSDTAEYGGYLAGPRVVDAAVRQHLQQVLAEVKDGTFAQRLLADHDAGAPELHRLRAETAAHPIGATGQEVRPLMAWLGGQLGDELGEDEDMAG
jgi:ketol-acid reductoisomerase